MEYETPNVPQHPHHHHHHHHHQDNNHDRYTSTFVPPTNNNHFDHTNYPPNYPNKASLNSFNNDHSSYNNNNKAMLNHNNHHQHYPRPKISQWNHPHRTSLINGRTRETFSRSPLFQNGYESLNDHLPRHYDRTTLERPQRPRTRVF